MNNFNSNKLRNNERKSEKNEAHSLFQELYEEYFENDIEEVRNKLHFLTFIYIGRRR